MSQIHLTLETSQNADQNLLFLAYFDQISQDFKLLTSSFLFSSLPIEGLRREIQILEEKLASVQSNNQKKDLLLSTVNQNIQDKKAWFNNLQATIRKVQASQQVLQSTMGKATGALSAAFENMDNVMEAV